MLIYFGFKNGIYLLKYHSENRLISGTSHDKCSSLENQAKSEI